MVAAETLVAVDGRVASTHKSVGSAVKALLDRGEMIGRSGAELQRAVERNGVVHVDLNSGGKACIAHTRYAKRLGLS